MAVLSWIPAVAAIAAIGCYAPDLRDCTVTCVADADCAPSQVCGSDGMCASPSLAGRCPGPSSTTVDAAGAIDAPAPVDATIVTDAAVDAATPVDAPMPAQVMLRIQIVGRGRVDVGGTSLSCSDASPNNTCTFTVVAGVPRTLLAAPDQGSQFDRWMLGCTGMASTCTLTPVAPLTSVQAKFKNGGGGGGDDDD
jgi:hypothetical protein